MILDEEYNKRLQEIVKIMGAQKTIKDGFLNKINTPEVLKLKEESLDLFSEYMSVNQKLHYRMAIHNTNLKRFDPEYIPYGIDHYGTINPNIPDDIKELIYDSRKKWQKHKPVEEAYTNMLHKNITNLAYDVTPENSIQYSAYGSTKCIFSEFYRSCKPFLILDIGMCKAIIINTLFSSKYCQTKHSVIMSDLKHRDDYKILIKNKDFFEAFRKELNPYRKVLFFERSFIRPDPVPVPQPFENIYTLHAQSEEEEYGRTKQYLIIGCMTYHRDRN